MNEGERSLWTVGNLECVMISCCAGAELQLRQVRSSDGVVGEGEIVLRELYPTKSDLYERARELRREHDPKAPPRQEETAESAKIP